MYNVEKYNIENNINYFGEIYTYEEYKKYKKNKKTI